MQSVVDLFKNVLSLTTTLWSDPWELRHALAATRGRPACLRPADGLLHASRHPPAAPRSTERSPLAQDTNEGGDSKYSTATGGGDSKCSTATGGGDSKYSTATHDNKMPPNGDSGVTHSGPLNEMPPDGYLLAEEPDAGGAPPGGSNLEHLANKDQVNTTEDGDTLHKVAS